MKFKTFDDNYFIKRGFREYPRTCFQSQYVEKFFQKCYKDEIGKKYFIDVLKYSEMCIPGRETIPASYEYSVQVRNKQGDAIDLLFHSTWHLKDVENYMEEMFKFGLFKYYERF